MGVIKIRGLKISARHGVYDFERTNPQNFLFDADLEYDFSSAVKCDDVSYAVNYAEVCALIEETTLSHSFKLIEKLAAECAFNILDKFEAVKKVKISCFKPDAPLPQQFENVGVEVEYERVKAYLSLGSSLGDREATLKKAISLLDATRGVKVEKVSPFLETQPYGGVAKNKFINCAVSIDTYLPPFTLLDEIHRIEDECGRVRQKRWDDRTADIDIIFYGDKKICTQTLTVPHRDYKNREFVLKPLKQIAPHLNL